MPRYLTPEWVESFDAALSALDLTDAVAAAGAGSLAAADGTFSVVQVVTGVPDDVQEAGGDVHLVLTVAGGRARLAFDHSGTAPRWDRPRRPISQRKPLRPSSWNAR